MDRTTRKYKSTFGEGNFLLLTNDSGHVMVEANSPDPGPLLMSTGTNIYFSCFFDVRRKKDLTLEVVELVGSVPPYFSTGSLSNNSVAPSFAKRILAAARVAAEKYVTEHPQDWYEARIEGCSRLIEAVSKRADKLKIELDEAMSNAISLGCDKRFYKTCLIELEETASH